LRVRPWPWQQWRVVVRSCLQCSVHVNTTSVIFCLDSLFISVFSTMNDLQEQLQKLLLTDVKYLITDISSCANGGFKCAIRLQCSTSDKCDQWVTEFSRVTLCTWRVRNTYPNRRRGLLYRKDYVCQHSAFNEDHPKRKKTRYRMWCKVLHQGLYNVILYANLQ